MQIQSQYSYSSSARKSLQQVCQSISNEAYTTKGLLDEYKETLQKTDTSRRENTEEEEVQEDSPSGGRNESKEVLRLGKENDEVTVVLETTQTKKQIVAYQDLDCWN